MLLRNMTAVDYFMRDTLHTSRTKDAFPISEYFGKFLSEILSHSRAQNCYGRYYCFL